MQTRGRIPGQPRDDDIPIARGRNRRRRVAGVRVDEADRLVRHAGSCRRRLRERDQRLPAGESVFERDQIARFVNGDVNVARRIAAPLAEIELHVRTHRRPGTPVPCVAVVPLHRIGCAGAIGLQQRIGHVLVARDRHRARFAV